MLEAAWCDSHDSGSECRGVLVAFFQGEMPAQPSADLVCAFGALEVSNLGHRTDFGFVRGLTPRFPMAGTLAGPAVTVKIPHLDSTAVQYALDLVRGGDILVIDQSGDDERSCFGGTLAAIAKLRGVTAVMTSGKSNDVDEIISVGLPVFSAGVTPHTTRVLGIEGAINVPIALGGTVVNPGDIVWADGDGIAVIPSGDAEVTACRLAALERDSLERDVLAQVRAGACLSELTGAREKFLQGAVA